MRALIPKLVLLGFSLSLAIGMGEVFVRLVVPVDLGIWRTTRDGLITLRPGIDTRLPSFGQDVRTNDLGFRIVGESQLDDNKSPESESGRCVPLGYASNPISAIASSGMLKLDDPNGMEMLLRSAGINRDVEELAKALSDMDLDTIRFDLEPAQDDDSSLKIRFKGKSNYEKRPAPVDLKLNINGDVELTRLAIRHGMIDF